MNKPQRAPEPPTLEELLAELEAAAAKAEAGAKSTAEWAHEWNCGYDKAKTIIKAAILAGRMTAANVLRPCIMRPGYRSQSTVYAFAARKRA